jgi:hypothetical protein
MTHPDSPTPPDEDPSDILDDRMVTPEKSMFGTRIPRPTGVGRHLIVVIILFLLALTMAIAFAERDEGASEGENPEDVRFTLPINNP